MIRRSTETITVLSPLSLTTVPWRTRLGIVLSLDLRRLSGPIAERGHDARDVATHLPHAGCALELAGVLLRAQVELLLFQLQELVVQLVVRPDPEVRPLAHAAASSPVSWIRRTNRVPIGSFVAPRVIAA